MPSEEEHSAAKHEREFMILLYTNGHYDKKHACSCERVYYATVPTVRCTLWTVL